MDSFKECLAEDYSKAVTKSLETILGKINTKEKLNPSLAWKGFPKIVESPESKQIISTFRAVR